MSPDFPLHEMEQKALTVRRRDSWDKQRRDRVSLELGCHQPIPGHYRRDEGICSLRGVPLFLRAREYKAKLWQSDSFAASADHTAGEREGGSWERRNEEIVRREACRWTEIQET